MLKEGGNNAEVEGGGINVEGRSSDAEGKG